MHSLKFMKRVGINAKTKTKIKINKQNTAKKKTLCMLCVCVKSILGLVSLETMVVELVVPTLA